MKKKSLQSNCGTLFGNVKYNNPLPMTFRPIAHSLSVLESKDVLRVQVFYRFVCRSL